jgi:general transcription factor IIIA
VAKYTEQGERRALSESSRQWKFVCDFEGCGQRFNRPCRLEAHTRSHTNERPFACPENGCDKAFPRKDHLKRHLKSAHNSEEGARPFACDWEGCDKAFLSAALLKRHKETHQTKFYCTGYPPCKDVFRKEGTLQAHIKTKHLSTVPFPCTCIDEENGEACTKGYQTESALRRHVAKAHGEREKEQAYFCMSCPAPGSEFEMIETLNGVVAVAKEPLAFPTHEDLVAHNRHVHPPICPECQLKCKSQATLKEHFEALHGDPTTRPKFPCPRPGCDRVFNKANNLKVHIASVHEQQKNFSCDAALFANSNKPELKAWDGHDACFAVFGSKAAAEQHVRTHHLNHKNRKESRKEAKSRKKPDPSAIRLLTGVGFDGGRTVPCLITHCEHRFFMDRDLRRHLSSTHKMSDVEIEEKIIERDALQGGPFWIGGMDGAELAMLESTEPSVPQTPDLFADEEEKPSMRSFMRKDDQDFKPIDPMLLGDPLDPFSLSLYDADEAAMDKEMGLGALETYDIQHGLPPLS